MAKMADTLLKELVPAEYGYVVLVACDGILLNFYLMQRVEEARKEYNVQYPTMYSDDNDKFNCIQRAHQNYLEGFPIFMTCLLVGGLKNPKVAAISGGVYLLGRFMAAKGYSTGDPEKRKAGGIPAMIGGLTLFGNMVCFGFVQSGLFDRCRNLFK